MITHALVIFSEQIAIYKHFDGYPSEIVPTLLLVVRPAGTFDRNDVESAELAGRLAARFIGAMTLRDSKITTADKRGQFGDVRFGEDLCIQDGGPGVEGRSGAHYIYRVDVRRQEIVIESVYDELTRRISFNTDPLLAELAATQVENEIQNIREDRTPLGLIESAGEGVNDHLP